MSIVIRAIDVGFGHTKYVTASTEGRVDCTHFPSLAFIGHAEESTALLRQVLVLDPGFEPAKELLDKFTFKQTADRVMATQPATTQATQPAP